MLLTAGLFIILLFLLSTQHRAQGMGNLLLLLHCSSQCRELMGLGKLGATEGYSTLLGCCLSFISNQLELKYGLVRTGTDVTWST